MPQVARVLDPQPVPSFAAYLDAGGGRGIEAAAKLGPQATIDDITASGLRGRGGAGFPTGVKWRTVAENRSPSLPTTVVVNAAEGEPGTFKDRMLLRRNPWRVLEGALVAAAAVGADRVVVATKASFTAEIERLRTAMADLAAADWPGAVPIELVEGPAEYLYGEETALLEVVAGRHPFPRIAPPFRHGVDEVGSDTTTAGVDLAGPGGATPAPPTLVNNVETLANVPLILAEGPAWFRAVGTEESPGTVVCTITGHTVRHGVGEFALGTPLREVVETLGDMAEVGSVTALLSGVANALVPADKLDTPMTYEHLQAVGSGLGAAGFIVFDERVDPVSIAQGVSRFLAVESCGQCTPCKQDGLALAELLDRVRRSEASEMDLVAISDRVGTVANEARCYLAHQHEQVVGSVLALFPDCLHAHAGGGEGPVPAELVAPVVDIVDGRAVLDERHLEKQPDWTYGGTYSGKSPADRIDQRTGEDDG